MAFNWIKRKKKKPAADVPVETDAGKTLPEAEIKSEPPDDPPSTVSEPESVANAEPEPAPEPEPEQVTEQEPEQVTEQEPLLESASEPEKPLKSNGFFSRLKKGLAKTRKILNTDIDDLFSIRHKVDDELLEDLEELLITSDIGVSPSMDLIEKISRQSAKISTAEQLKDILKKEICTLFHQGEKTEIKTWPTPRVIMVVGVNGVGKTTTIGKLASRFSARGQKVLIAAGDTFRAAAVEQLTIWADRSGAELVKHRDGADPAAVAFDAVEAAQARGCDIVLVDTAGRLHTQVNLMEELKKIKRSIAKALPEAPHEILLVLDATTGQNALSQANLFNEAIDITSLALTKLDGTAKGGIVVGICNTLDIPLRYIGVGEGINDLQDFDPITFVDALF
jgi:fused signal recognition particle receptor